MHFLLLEDTHDEAGWQLGILNLYVDGVYRLNSGAPEEIFRSALEKPSYTTREKHLKKSLLTTSNELDQIVILKSRRKNKKER